MLEFCAVQSAGAMNRAALDVLRKWRQVGGCSTDRVCRCGTAARQHIDVTAENASEQWWGVNFDWLDA
jgi:hypothetical protein